MTEFSISKMQCTLGESLSYAGVAVKQGVGVKMTLRPASPHTGIRFLRTDIERVSGYINASRLNVIDSRQGTVIANEFDVSIGAVEHLLSVLRICGIDNLLIEVSGPEIPALDGGHEPLVKLIQRATVAPQQAMRSGIWIEHPIEYRRGHSRAILRPGYLPRITIDIEQVNGFGTAHQLSLELTERAFIGYPIAVTESGARPIDDYGPMLGNARCNTVSVENHRSTSRCEKIYREALARLRLLECCGNLALAGAPIFGHLQAHEPDHKLILGLLHKLFAEKGNWSHVRYDVIQERLESEQNRFT